MVAALLFGNVCEEDTKGAFFWGYSIYSYSGLGITEYKEFQFRKERSLIWKRNTHGGGDLGTSLLSQKNTYSVYSE